MSSDPPGHTTLALRKVSWDLHSKRLSATKAPTEQYVCQQPRHLQSSMTVSNQGTFRAVCLSAIERPTEQCICQPWRDLQRNVSVSNRGSYRSVRLSATKALQSSAPVSSQGTYRAMRLSAIEGPTEQCVCQQPRHYRAVRLSITNILHLSMELQSNASVSNQRT